MSARQTQGARFHIAEFQIMSGIFSGGGLNIGSLFSTVALAALTGGTSLAFQSIFQQIISSVASQVIQQVGQQLGLPQGAIDLAQGVFQAASGNPGGAAQSLSESVQNASDAFNFSPQEQGDLQRSAEDVAQSWTNSILEQVRDGGEGKSTKGDSFLVALAKALGKVMDNKMGQMKAKTDQLGGLDSKDSKYGQLTAEIQALGQEMNMVSQALNNSIKSIGEAGSALARKG